MHPEPALQVTDARKRFGSIDALAGLSLDVQAHEWVGLLGPNGAGKSTLMSAIAGLVKLDRGQVALFGEPTGAENPASRTIGFVPQEIALYPLLSAEENLNVFGQLHGVERRALAQRVAWALQWTGLDSRARDLVGGFSGGMKRRLNIACGVLHEPRLILLDEPTVGVDPQGRQRIWAMLDELRRSGASLVQSTHELHEIETICDRMVIMDNGRVIASGTVRGLVEQTLGPGATLHLTLERPATHLTLDGFDVADDTLHGAIHDVATELPALLATLREKGLGVRDLRVERPDLETVFTHLTGRELRE